MFSVPHFSTFSLAFILVFWWFKVGIPNEPLGDLPTTLYYPGMLAMSLYMGALLQCTMLGSTILGVEGKRMWIMKSNPVESVLIMKGKATALVMMALPGLIAIWIPICILAQFPLKVTLIFWSMSFDTPFVIQALVFGQVVHLQILMKAIEAIQIF